MLETPVFSALDTEDYTPPDSPRTYTLGALTFRERQAFKRDLRAYGGVQVSHRTILDGLRAALREVAPANMDELLGYIDAAEEAPDDERAQAMLSLIEQVVVDVPSYQMLNNAQQRWADACPFVGAMHGLRGWSGEGLPPFERVGGVVPEALLDAIPANELASVGWRAHVLAALGRRAVGNSEAPSPAPETPKPTTEG